MAFLNEANWVKVDKTVKPEVGEIVWIRAKSGYSYLWSAAYAADRAEKKINESGSYEVRSINYVDDPGYIWFKVKVVDGKQLVNTAGIFIPLVILASLAIIGMTVFKSFEFYRDAAIANRDAEMFSAVGSGNLLFEEAQVMLEVSDVMKQGTDTSIGSQVQKAGIGLALPLLAIAAIIFLKNK